MATQKAGSGTIKLAPIRCERVTMRIVGKSPLVQHQWAEKALQEMRDKHKGIKQGPRKKRDPEAEGLAARYLTADGRPGVPAMAIKSALITAAHKDLGVEKTLVRKALFLICDDPGKILPLDCDEPEYREDTVRVGVNQTDLRYRPYYLRWSVELTWEIDADLLNIEDLVNLVNRAGFGVGIGEWRPEKGGDYGRFEVDTEGGISATAVGD